MNVSLIAALQSSPVAQTSTPEMYSAYWSNLAGVGGIVLLILAGFAILVLIILTLVRLFKFLGSARKEQQLIRFELGKLAEEVHQIRKDLKAKE